MKDMTNKGGQNEPWAAGSWATGPEGMWCEEATSATDDLPKVARAGQGFALQVMDAKFHHLSHGLIW